MNSTKKLIIVFVKNTELGKVKTRLAETIGAQKAIEVYTELVNMTRQATRTLPVTKWIYFSDAANSSQWPSDFRTVQQGEDLGEKMCNAFQDAFQQGFEQVVLIGSDLPDMSKDVLEEAFVQLEHSDLVFGPAEDGGYYLVGMSSMHHGLFKNKPWSQAELLHITLDELNKEGLDVSLLKPLNDIDTFEDYRSSTLYQSTEDTRIEV